MTKFHYNVGQHDVGDMEYAFVDSGANGGICGTDMLVLKGSEHLLMLLDWQGAK
jgi:hypothetical protein